MQKIMSLFQRDYTGNRQVRDEVVPGAEWVINGEGMATEKFDGTCCLIHEDGRLYRRYDAKEGKSPPRGFIAAQDPDPVTGHWPGWIGVKADDPADAWHMEAMAREPFPLIPGTYELVGPKIQKNPYNFNSHRLIKHGSHFLPNLSRELPKNPRTYTFESVKELLTTYNIEGIVWHHPDGRMVKIKAKDFGIKWPRDLQKSLR
jgi:hypothetical protein